MTEKLLIAALVLVCISLLGFSLYMILRSVGSSSLYRHGQQASKQEITQNLIKSPESDAVQEEQEVFKELEEGQLIYKGEVWAYNEDIMSFLCMGVDAQNGVTTEKTYGKAGQADAIMLIVINPHKEEIEILNINRDSMVEIELYDTDGNYAGSKMGQIALQYAYGDGRVRSCELMEQTVSDLLYGIPIHGYIAMDMQSIPAINDLVGGVEVTVPEDMTAYKNTWYQNASIHLNGEDALLFIRERDENSSELGSNLKRIERQKQYLGQFAVRLKEKTKKDITFPLSLYNKVQKHIVTSFSVDEITYLASTVLGYDFSMEKISSIAGDMKMGEKNEEFYVDEEALRNKIIETFYEKVQ